MPDATTIASDFLCPTCGYNLRGLTQDRCPECGSEFDRAALSNAQLPWPHRRHLGRFRSYWRTVWQVTFHPKLLAAEFCRPVDYAAAQRFRWFTIFWIWLPFLCSTIITHANNHEDYLCLKSAGLIPDLWLSLAAHLTLILALAVLTGVPTYFFHPRRLPVEFQNRGIALAYYACAPLAWMPVVYAAGLLVSAFPFPRMTALYSAAALAGVLLLLWWSVLARLVHRILRQEANATIFAYFVPPLLALIAATTAFCLLFQTARYFGLLIFSLLP
jgi:hypothetical protein